MSQYERELRERLEAMPLEEARRAIANGAFGQLGSPNHEFCVAWLTTKDAELQHLHAAESIAIARAALDNSKYATRIAVVALILSVIVAALEFVP